MTQFHLKALLVSLCSATILSAAAGDNVSVYSGGLSLGGQAMMNDNSDRAENMYATLGFNNRFTINDHVDIFADVEWYGFTSGSYGLTSGIDGTFGSGKVRPFVGAGGGIAWYDHGDKLNTGLGMMLKAHGGVQIDVTDRMGITFSVPLRYTANEASDQLDSKWVCSFSVPTKT